MLPLFESGEKYIQKEVIEKLRFEYRNQFNSLKMRILEMGKLISGILRETISVVQDNNIDLAKKIFESDIEVDKLERDIESNCLKIVSLQSPFASDLRAVTGYLKIITDLERIADHCADVCEIVSMGNLGSFSSCSEKTVSILQEVFEIYEKTCDACFKLDVDIARSIFKKDDKIDAMFSDIILEISDSISKKDFSVYLGADLMFIAKYAERMGDHCANISKWIIYINVGFFPDRNFFD